MIFGGRSRAAISIVLGAGLLAACAGPAGPVAPADAGVSGAGAATAAASAPNPTLTATTPPTATPAPAPSVTPSPAAAPLPTPSPTPDGCLRPPDDYTRMQVREHTINRRTLAMLEHAQALYGGPHDFVDAITQGSYHPGVEASFGTHDGGGAVDLSVRNLQDWHDVLYDELEAIILALRRAGFAAWVREEDDLYPGSPIHIHAIAVGDAELSPAAQEQLTGPAGYFRGFDGLPADPPQPDRHGGPVLCPWMEKLGYRDLRAGAAPARTQD